MSGTKFDQRLITVQIKEIDKAMEKLARRRKAVENGACSAFMETLPWREFNHQPGEWVYILDAKGEMRDELRKFTPLIHNLAKKGQIVIGDYEYRLSGQNNRFLNRYPKQA